MKFSTLGVQGQTTELLGFDQAWESPNWLKQGGRLYYLNDLAPKKTPFYIETEDAGRTWSQPRTLPLTVAGPGLVRAAADEHSLWLTQITTVPPGPCLRSIQSTDGGRTWSAPLLVRTAERAGCVGALACPGGLELFFVEGDTGLGATRLREATLASGSPSPLSSADIGDFQFAWQWASVARTRDGTLHLLARATAEPHALLYARRPSSRGNWQAARLFLGKTIGAPGDKRFFPQLAAAGTDVYALWMDDSAEAGTERLRFARSLDAGETWEGPMALPSTPTFQKNDYWFDLKADGPTVAVAYFAGGNSYLDTGPAGMPLQGIRVLVSGDRGAHFDHSGALSVAPEGHPLEFTLVFSPGALQVGMFWGGLSDGACFATFPSVLPPDYVPRGDGSSAWIR